MSKAVMQQAQDALFVAREFTELYGTEHAAWVNEKCHEAIDSLRAALVEQDDDLTAAWMAGAAAERKRAEQSLRDLCAAAYQVVGVADGPVEMLDNLVAAAEGEPLPHDPGAGLPWSPPSPQPLKELPPLPEPWITDTEECGTSHDGESLHQDIPLFTADQMRDYARAVEIKAPKPTAANARDDELAELRRQRDELRRALEIIAVGDAEDPKTQAAEELAAIGYWGSVPEPTAANARDDDLNKELDIPELDANFFDGATLTRPGERLTEPKTLTVEAEVIRRMGVQR